MAGIAAHRAPRGEITMSKNYLSAKAWHSAKTAMRKRGETGTPTIKNVRTHCWSVTISLKEDSGNTLDSVHELFDKLAETGGFAGCFSEEEGKAKDANGVGYRHIQAAVYWDKEKTGPWVMEQFEGTKAHIEPALNAKALADYVKKDDTHISGPYAFGHWQALEEKLANSQRGKRTDLDRLDEKILEGATYTDLLLDPEVCKSLDRHKTWVIDRINALKCGRYEFENRSLIDPHGMMLVCDYVWGTSGLAKSGVVQQFFGPRNVFSVTEYDKGFIFDGYRGQEVLFLDEFKGNGIPFKKLLKIMQGYPFECDIKGSHIWAGWKKVIIASSVSPLEIYRGLDPKDGERLQFWRRLSEGVVINANKQPFAKFYPYDSPEDAMLGITKMPKGLKGYGPEYWKKHQLDLPTEFTYEYADPTEHLTKHELYEMGYNPDDDEEDW